MTQPYPYPAQPQFPGFPQQPTAQPAQPYLPPAQGYYPPALQQYAPPAPAQPLATGTLDTFFSQPSTGGGKSLSFEQPGTRYIGIVTRPITNGDIQQQTDTQGRPQTFRDGRPKFVMKVPLQMQPTAAYPDGLAQLYVKGQMRDELVRAIAAAGAPEGPPEAGSIIDITFTSTRPSGAGMNPAKLFSINYQRPQGAPPAAQPAATAPAPPVQPAVQQPLPTVPAPAVPVPPPVQAPAPPTFLPAAPMAPAVPQSPVAAPAAPAAPPQAELSPEQMALLAKLTGQSA